MSGPIGWSPDTIPPATPDSVPLDSVHSVSALSESLWLDVFFMAQATSTASASNRSSTSDYEASLAEDTPLA